MQILRQLVYYLRYDGVYERAGWEIILVKTLLCRYMRGHSQHEWLEHMNHKVLHVAGMAWTTTSLASNNILEVGQIFSQNWGETHCTCITLRIQACSVLLIFCSYTRIHVKPSGWSYTTVRCNLAWHFLKFVFDSNDGDNSACIMYYANYMCRWAYIWPTSKISLLARLVVVHAFQC